MSNILLSVFYDISGWLLQAAVVSIQLTFTFGLICAFRKPLDKIASMKYVIGFIGSTFFLYAILNPKFSWLLDLRALCSFFGIDLPEPLFHLGEPTVTEKPSYLYIFMRSSSTETYLWQTTSTKNGKAHTLELVWGHTVWDKVNNDYSMTISLLPAA